MVAKEEFIWEGCSSQILNFKPFFFSLIAIAIIVAGSQFVGQFLLYLLPVVLIYIGLNYLSIRSQKYKLSNQRLIMESGLFNKITDEVELYRIKDHRLEQPLYLRLFGLGNIVLITSDQLNYDVVIRAIPDAVDLKESIRLLVEARRTSKGVREIDNNDHLSYHS